MWARGSTEDGVFYSAYVSGHLRKFISIRHPIQMTLLAKTESSIPLSYIMTACHRAQTHYMFLIRQVISHIFCIGKNKLSWFSIGEDLLL